MQTDRFPAIQPRRSQWGLWGRRAGTHGAALVVGALLAASPTPTPVAPLAAAPTQPPSTVTAPPTTETVTEAPPAAAASRPPAVVAPIPAAAKPAAPRTSIAKATATTKPAAPRLEVENATAHYANCAAAKRAGAAPLHRGGPGYRAGLDRDSDGVACET